MRCRFLVVLTMAAAAALFSAGVAWAAADAGQVLTFNGNCFVETGGQRTQLKMGATIHVGDVIDVPDGAKLKLRMVDGSVLALGSGTHMTIKAYSASGGKRDAQVQISTGIIRSVVAKMTQPSSFEVDSATGVAAARSTDYFVEATPDKTTVAVLDGSVKFAARTPSGATEAGGVLIPPRSGSEIDSGPPPAAAPGAKPAAAPRRLEPTPAVAYTQAQFDDLINRTSVAFGFCQCIADTTHIAASCETSVDACKTKCGGKLYAYVPNARQSCKADYADVVVEGHAN
ncbi:MAG TPA: FecR family protein [Stellaceae bacterium]|nr:FecR family protein [Stellaceae bacterium]